MDISDIFYIALSHIFAIYRQMLDDIINGTYDSAKGISRTYSEAWDVKSFHSNFPTDSGGYTLAASMKAIYESIEAGEYVILDTTYLNEADLAELLNEIFEEGLLDRIIVWP